MEANKALVNIGLVPCIQGSQQPYQESKEGHFLVGEGVSRYFGDSEKRESHSNL